MLQPNCKRLAVGLGQSVRGRVDGSGRKMEAGINTETRVMSITCVTKPEWFINVNFSNFDKDNHVTMTTSMHGLTGGYNEGQGLCRFDATSDLAFWLEIDKSVWTFMTTPEEMVKESV